MLGWSQRKERVFFPPFPPLFFLRLEGAWQTTHTAGNPRSSEKGNRTKTGKERKKGPEKKRTRTQKLKKKKEKQRGFSVLYLVVDIKHALLDLLIDLLGCVDESLRRRQEARQMKRRDLIHICAQK